MYRLVDWWIGCRGRGPGACQVVQHVPLSRSDADAEPTGTPGQTIQATFAAVVTGGSRGIGLEIARRLVRAGWTVVLVARDPERLAAAASDLSASATEHTGHIGNTGQSADYKVLTFADDIADPELPDRLAQFLTSNALICDLLINNAGIGVSGPFARLQPDRLDQMIAINISGLTRLTRRFLPGMLERRRGGVLNVASLGGYPPGPYQSAYYASKAYVISLTEALAWEIRGRGVRISALAPGPVETDFHANMGAERTGYRMFFRGITANRAARAGLHGLWLGRTVVVPGALWSTLALALHAIPRKILSAFVGLLLKPRGDGRHVRCESERPR